MKTVVFYWANQNLENEVGYVHNGVVDKPYDKIAIEIAERFPNLDVMIGKEVVVGGERIRRIFIDDKRFSQR